MMIVLDTNVFCAEADPEEAAGLKTLLALAKETETTVRIPVPCVIEAREFYRRKLQEAIEEVKTARQKAVRVANLAINEAAEVEAYERRLSKFILAHGIETIPFPNFPEPRTLLELAAKKQNPFDPGGNNYRDAVIYLAVSQFAESAKVPLRLVTGDKSFRGVVNPDVRIKPVTLQQAIDELKTRLSTGEAQRRVELNKRIAAAVSGRVDEIAKIARRDVPSLLGDQIDFRLLTVMIDDLVLESALVEAAETSGLRTQFTATMKAEVHCTLHPRYSTAPYSFGEHHRTILLPTLLGSENVIGDKQIFRVRMIVEGEVTLDEKGNVQSIEFKPEVRGRAIS